MRRLATIGILLIIVGTVSLLAYLFFKESVPEALPNPNAYDDFVRAGRMLTGKVPDSDTATLDACRAFVSSNRAALDLSRSALAKECRVPTKYTQAWH
jgi:hypothetical protein